MGEALFPSEKGKQSEPKKKKKKKLGFVFILSSLPSLVFIKTS